MSEFKKEQFALSDEELKQASGGYSLEDILGDLNKGTETTGIKEAIEEIKEEVTGLMGRLTDKDDQSVVSSEKAMKRAAVIKL